jgi:hypothetical protein
MQNHLFAKIVLLAILLTVSICSLASAVEYRVPEGQPTQIKSTVTYDPQLYDPFFESNEWSYPWFIIIHADGDIENTTGGTTDEKELPRLQHTANCFTAHQGEHAIKFCEARLLTDNTIELFVHDMSPSTNDNLKILVKDGLFSCQYWTTYVADKGDEGLIWTTKRQKLILDKKVYTIGSVIKGKIEFECLQEVTNPKYGGGFPRSIIIKGVFKTTLK